MSDANELCYTSATDALHRFRTGSLSPVELTRALITRSEAVNPQINAYTYTFYDRALEAAKQAEARYGNGTNRPPEGITLVVKDSNAVAGEVTTYGSKIYADHRPERSHPGVQRLLDAGAILLARSTMPEFGEAGNCYTPLWGVTRNPWNLDYGPGGSSGGAGAVLAAGMTTLADGSDIGGSIRIPAACCGAFGGGSHSSRRYLPTLGTRDRRWRRPLPRPATGGSRSSNDPTFTTSSPCRNDGSS